MSDFLQVFLVAFLGFVTSFSIVFLAIRIIAVEIAHREFDRRVHLDWNVDTEKRIPLERIPPCEQVYQGDMLEALRGTTHHVVTPDGKLEQV
jgi:hypothetical protein